MPPDRDPLSDAVARLDVDPLDAAQERVREHAERQVTAPEARSLGKLARDVLGPVLSAIKRAVGW